MTETEKEIRKIFDEIEQNNYQKEDCSRSTKEIVGLLLNRPFEDEKELTRLEAFKESGFQMDLEELRKWKENNNQIYEVSYGHFIFNNRRFIGKIIVFFRKIVRRLLRFLIEPIIAEQNQFNGSVTASINAIYNNDLVMQSYISIQEQKIKELEENCRSVEEKLNSVSEELSIKAEEVNNTIEQTMRLLGDDYSSIDYFKFEDHFRGSREQVKLNQEQYVEYFRNTGLILDLGCGRGEFLELLAENEIAAKGVDLYEEFVDYCSSKKLDVVCEDAITYLDGVRDKSIGGVFASQLVEHLKFGQMVELCNKAYQKLMRGSYLIIETPNPTSLNTFTNAFYVDPSHNKPIHPQTLKYILENIGFEKVEVLFTENSKSTYELQLLNAENVYNLGEFNDGINCVSNIMFGSQDYAIIAKK